MGDLNGDGAVNRTDAALMAQVYGQCSVSPSPAASPATAGAVIAGRISGADSSLNPRLAAKRKAAAPRASAVDQFLASNAPLAASVPLRIRSSPWPDPMTSRLRRTRLS
jgi:hypothetical protein